MENGKWCLAFAAGSLVYNHAILCTSQVKKLLTDDIGICKVNNLLTAHNLSIIATEQAALVRKCLFCFVKQIRNNKEIYHLWKRKPSDLNLAPFSVLIPSCFRRLNILHASSLPPSAAKYKFWDGLTENVLLYSSHLQKTPQIIRGGGVVSSTSSFSHFCFSFPLTSEEEKDHLFIF